MPGKEQLVESLPDWQDGGGKQEHHAKGSDDTPDPVVELGFRRMLSRLHVVVEVDRRVNASLQSCDTGNPTMQEQESRVGPVGQ